MKYILPILALIQIYATCRVSAYKKRKCFIRNDVRIYIHTIFSICFYNLIDHVLELNFSFNIKKDLLNDLTCSKFLFIVSIFFIMNEITRCLCLLNLKQYNVNFGLNIVLVSIQHA